MREFGDHAPRTLDEAIALLECHEANARRGGAAGLRANPALRTFAERLRAAGKRPKVVVVAVMRKLLVLAWTLLRSGQPFSLSQGTVASAP